jgi:hypothetical protein
MSYLSSNNTLKLILLIVILIIIILIITNKKTEIFTDVTTTTKSDTTTTKSYTTTTTKLSYNMCQSIDNNIKKLQNDLSTGKEYLQEIEDSADNDSNLEKCIVYDESTLIDLLFINEMKEKDKDISEIKKHIKNELLVTNFFKVLTLELTNTLRDTLTSVSKRLLKDSSVEEDIAELLKKVVDDDDKLDEKNIKSIIDYLRKYSETRASVFTIDERTPVKKECQEVPPFLKNMDQCNQYGYLSNLEQTIIKNECNKCNSCSDDNYLLSYQEQMNKMDTGVCNDICNKRSELGVPEYCQSKQSKMTSDNTNNNEYVEDETENTNDSVSRNNSQNNSTNTTSTKTTTSVRTTTSTTPEVTKVTKDTTKNETKRSQHTREQNRKTMPAYGENMDLGDYFNIEDIGKSISNNVGEVMTKLGYAGYNPEIEETPIPRVYDNTIDYRVLNQGLSNLEQDQLNKANKKSVGSGGGGTNYSAPIVVQEDIQGVSNVFAPYIIFHNSDHQPNANMGQNGMIESSTERIEDPEALNIDGLPIEKYLKSVM